MKANKRLAQRAKYFNSYLKAHYINAAPPDDVKKNCALYDVHRKEDHSIVCRVRISNFLITFDGAFTVCYINHETTASELHDILMAWTKANLILQVNGLE